MSTAEFRALAEFRYQIRHFLNSSERAARAAGLVPQQYLFLLAVRGLPEARTATIRELAERMQLRHHSAVELVDRLEKRGYVRRARSKEDRRQVLVSLQPKGQKVLERVVQQRISELRASGRELVKAIDALLRDGRARNSNGRLQNVVLDEGGDAYLPSDPLFPLQVMLRVSRRHGHAS